MHKRLIFVFIFLLVAGTLSAVNAYLGLAMYPEWGDVSVTDDNRTHLIDTDYIGLGMESNILFGNRFRYGINLGSDILMPFDFSNPSFSTALLNSSRIGFAIGFDITSIVQLSAAVGFEFRIRETHKSVLNKYGGYYEDLRTKLNETIVYGRFSLNFILSKICIGLGVKGGRPLLYEYSVSDKNYGTSFEGTPSSGSMYIAPVLVIQYVI